MNSELGKKLDVFQRSVNALALELHEDVWKEHNRLYGEVLKALDEALHPLMEAAGKPVFAGDVTFVPRESPDVEAMKLDRQRYMGLFQDLIYMATNAPDLVTAFNSPLLQLITIELYTMNNPDYDKDGEERHKFRVALDRQKAGL